MTDTYALKISFTQGHELATWTFNHEDDKHCCDVHQGDIVNVTFDGPGTVAESVMLCGQLEADKTSSPFTEGNRINVRDNPTLHVGQETGHWGFSVAFTTRNVDGTSSFYYVPDPEIIVGTRPGSDD